MWRTPTRANITHVIPRISKLYRAEQRTFFKAAINNSDVLETIMEHYSQHTEQILVINDSSELCQLTRRYLNLTLLSSWTGLILGQYCLSFINYKYLFSSDSQLWCLIIAAITCLVKLTSVCLLSDLMTRNRVKLLVCRIVMMHLSSAVVFWTLDRWDVNAPGCLSPLRLDTTSDK